MRLSRLRRGALHRERILAPSVARNTESNGLRIRQLDGQLPVLRGFLRWSTQFRALFVRARGRTGDGRQHVGLLDLFGPLAVMIAGVDRSGQKQLAHGSDLLRAG